MTVELPTSNGDDAQIFTGPHRTQVAEGKVSSDFVLVFVDGVFWLERVSDYANCLRPGERRSGSSDPLEDPMMTDDVNADPDSWMGGDDESGSPITPEDPEEEEIEDNAPNSTSGNGAAHTITRNGFGSKAPTGMSGGSTMGIYNGRHEPSARNLVGAKTVAAKTVAGKSVSNVNGPAARRRNDSAAEEEVVEAVVVDEEEGNASNSSSSDEDSDESDSDSDSESGASYTDGSTDDE